jgi:hypothetical protein
MERAGDRYGKMAGYCSTGQSPQRAVVLMEEEEEEEESVADCPLSEVCFISGSLGSLSHFRIALTGYSCIDSNYLLF